MSFSSINILFLPSCFLLNPVVFPKSPSGFAFLSDCERFSSNCKLFSRNNILFSCHCKCFSCYCERFSCHSKSFSCCRFFNNSTFIQFTSIHHEFLSACVMFSCSCKLFTRYCSKFSCHCKSFSCRCGKFRQLSRHNFLTCVHRPKCLDLCVISPTFCKHIWSLFFKGSNLFFAPNKLAKWLTLLTRRN